MRKLLIGASALLFAAISAMPATAGWDEGVAAFTSKNYQQAASEFKELVAQNPDGYRAQYMLGASLMKLGRKEEALNHLRKAYDLNPNELSVKMELGKAYLSLRRYKDVSNLLGTVDASALPSAHQKVFYQMRGEARLKSNNMNGALGDFQQLARLSPQDADIQYKLGAVALKADRLDDALTALDKAVRLDGSADKKKAYTQALLKKGRESSNKTEKRTRYLKASELASDLVAANASYDNLMLKMSAELGAGQYAQAAATGEKAMVKNPNDWLAAYYTGQAYTSAKNFSKAEAPLRKALKQASASDQRKVWTQLGYTFEKMRRFTESIEAYQNGGDRASADRVAKNAETEQYNKSVEDENAQIRAMEEEAKRLEEELKKLDEGGGE